MTHHHLQYREPSLLHAATASRLSGSPASIANAWVEAFNASNIDRLLSLYAHRAEFEQPVEEPLKGRKAVSSFLAKCFELHKKTLEEDRSCIVDNVVADGDWAVVRWHDGFGCTGCHMFRCRGGLIARHYGFWDVRGLEMVYESDRP